MAGDGDSTPDLFGLSVEDAVEELPGEDDQLRATLERVAADGVVSPAGVEAAVAHASKVVATPETRLELAEDTLDEVREDAADVADVDAVASRLEAFETRRADVAERLDGVQSDLQSVLARAENPEDAYALARAIEDLEAAADDVHRAADELAVDVEEFGRWLADPERREREFREDLSALERAVDDLDADPADAEAWLDATLRRRALSLLTRDLRAERADLETLAGDGLPAAFGERLDAVEDRLAAAEGRLAGAARPDWRERYGDRVAAFEAAVEGMAPPVPWAAVWARYEEHAPADATQ